VEFRSEISFWTSVLSKYEIAEACVLISVVHYKCTKGNENEFLLVRVRHPCGAIALLSVDRSLARAAAAIKPDPETSASASWRLPVGDRIIVSPDGSERCIKAHFESCKPARTLTFPEQSSTTPRPSLAQFSVLLSVVTQEDDCPTHDPACYWFAGATWEALRSLFPHAVVGSEARHLHPSTFRGVVVPQDYATKALVDKYEVAWDEFTHRAIREEERRKQEEEKVVCFLSNPPHPPPTLKI
jgi:hypothetical protein